ncbi:MAG: Cgl0159 family (beta/alpha)8-fold protein [Acidimicrobiales bacterium]
MLDAEAAAPDPVGSRLGRLAEIRAFSPGSISEAAHRRRRRQSLLGETGRLVIIAADHPARGALGAGRDPMAMADRAELLERLVLALSRPGVDGLLGTPDVVEDLLMLGALDEKVVIGSMNRGGQAGAVFEMDDRVTAYSPKSIQAGNLDGGKMLLRIDGEDPGSVATLQACAAAIDDLAERGLMAMLEPFVSFRVKGRVRNDLRPDSVARSLAVASGLGGTSCHTWLKVPVVEDMQRVMRSSSLPALLLGGEVTDEPTEVFRTWERALRIPTVFGVVAGRSLLYPADGNVQGAVDEVVEMVDRSAGRMDVDTSMLPIEGAGSGMEDVGG